MPPKERIRCAWSASAPEFPLYHDTEWGFPVDDDRRLFEKLSLEGFQSGLSWRTILVKRENFREAFKNFEADRVARFTEKDVVRLLGNEGIIRHRGKIEAVIENAKRMKELAHDEGSLSAFVWKFEPVKQRKAGAPPIATSPESIALSKALKKRGFKFVGPTTVYSFMQAMGLVNDHSPECFVRGRVEKARKKFEVPR